MPTDLTMKALHGEIAAEILLAVAAFMMFPDSTVESLTSQYALTGSDVKHARNLLQIEPSETPVKVESPSTPTDTEDPIPESKGIREAILSRFPEATVTDQDVKQLEDSAGYEWVEAICIIMYSNHLEGKTVHNPVPLIVWWVKTHTKDKAVGIANGIQRAPRSRDSILSETLMKAKDRVPPAPSAQGAELHAKNEAVRRARGNDQ
jgi:hypothetical protein